MRSRIGRWGMVLLVGVGGLGWMAARTQAAEAQVDPLGSWREGPSKQRILSFIDTVTTEGPGFVPPEERIAVFDNDGTLWTEQPAYSQLFFTLDRLEQLAPEHPEWRAQQPFKAALERDLRTLARLTKPQLAELLAATHTGMSPELFVGEVRAWMQDARHPELRRAYALTVYQPMVELLAYLEAHGFTNYLVSSGGVDFMRAFAEPLYGIPSERVIGTGGKLRFEVRGSRAGLQKVPELADLNAEEGKAVHIWERLGRRPILAFGNSDGDLQMLQYTALAPGPRLALLLHHDDAEREVAYDRGSPIGALDKALDEARRHDWTVVSMRRDWARVFPEEP